MKIVNAKITDAEVMKDEAGRLVLSISFKKADNTLSRNLSLEHDTDVLRIKKMMEYAEVENFNEPNQKIIRLVFVGDYLNAFGHPVEDKFIQFIPTDFEEITEAKLEELLPSE